jgi:hypothetical protein
MNPIHTRKRTRTRQTPNPPQIIELPPIPPRPDEPKPEPRKRGRPKGLSEGPVLLHCPFASIERGEYRCLTYPDPVEKGRVK